MAKPKAGQVVKADFGDGEGEQFALIVKAGSDKDTLVALGHGQPAGYREPEDRAGAGSGGTWWSVK